MRITCRESDVLLFTADDIGFLEDADVHDGVVVVDDERNYANVDDLPLDVPFYGYHDSGGSYGPGVFACDGTDFIEVEGIDGSPVAQIERNGQPREYDLRQARTYYRILANAERLLGAAKIIEAQREASEGERRVAMGLPAVMPEYEGIAAYSEGGGD